MAQKMKILVAVDLSEFSEAIIRFSGQMAKKVDAVLLLVNVINQRDLDMVHRTMIGYESFSYPNYLAGQEQDRETRMKKLVQKGCGDAVPCRYAVRNGVPHHELLDVIKSEKPDLVVVGTKGRSNLTDVIVGSTARKLYRRSPVPLLTIPAGYDENNRG